MPQPMPDPPVAVVPKTSRPTGPAPDAASLPTDVPPSPVDPLSLAVMAQALHDLAAGQVDTDMRAAPGLDAQRRAELVPGTGGRPPAQAGGVMAPTAADTPARRRATRPQTSVAGPGRR